MHIKIINKISSIKSLKHYIEHLLLIGLFGTLIIPSLNLGIGINFITIISVVLSFLLIFFIDKKHIKINRFIIWYILILISMFYSINYGYVILNVEITYRDYMEWFRYAQVLPYLLVSSIIDYNSFEKKLFIYLKFSVIFILFIAFLQITNILNIGYNIAIFYSGLIQAEGLLESSKRIMITGSDPNVGALIVVFFLFLIFLSKETNINKNFIVISLTFILMMTQSRTVFLGLVSSIFIYMLIFSKINFFIKIFIILLISYILYESLLFLNLEYIILGFQMALDGTNTSLNVRFENIILAYERFLDSIILGWGPAKSIHDTVIDSEYALILQRYGLLGMFLFLGYLLLIMHFSYKLHKKQFDCKVNTPLVGFLISIIGFTVMFTNNFFAGYQAVAISTLIVVTLTSYKNKYYEIVAQKKEM